MAKVGLTFIKMKVYPLIWASLLLKQRENWWWWFKLEKVGDLVIWLQKSWWFGDSRGGSCPPPLVVCVFVYIICIRLKSKMLIGRHVIWRIVTTLRVTPDIGPSPRHWFGTIFTVISQTDRPTNQPTFASLELRWSKKMLK